MREGVNAVKRFAAAPAFADYVVGPFGDSFSAATNDSATEDYVRGLTTTIFHPVGTAAMSQLSSTNGVVNPDLTVKGTDGLRIVDASIFVSHLHFSFEEFSSQRSFQPFIPSCHPQGSVYLLAERASDIIKLENPL